ncbi:dihydrolipoyl dehydrogenase [Sphingomonas sp. CFBP 8760]|uniref:dihydrolipoyl dehydrogenase n=1 Tax=Sphingomonas sp. CFBP 8760 TaxID=2775282 RepID=UPI0017807666|nr:dihydrolipoyl dehydrogenase [Sphingomonas sp. CFBP 8760]MBD8548597.1 dihydrolipoyl dehydrogenase [Sphingomonas sp. CFBP 8760]
MADTTTADLTCDVVVIGAGTAGLAAERVARSEGARTLLIDDRFAGTTCATVGCMPSKLLITAGMAAQSIRRAEVFGIDATPRIDGKRVMQRVRCERDRFVAATRQGFDDLPEGVAIKACARFTGPNTLVLDDGRIVSARTVVIATGSKPIIPEPFRKFGDVIDTNDTIFELDELPRSLAVIGAGALGLELAQAFASLGVEVVVFEHGDHVGGVHDPVVEAELKRILRRCMTLHLGVDASPSAEDGGVVINWDGGSQRFDRVLVSTGREPKLDGLGLDQTGLALNDRGVPIYDKSTMQCGDAPIFIAGDADADRSVLHEAANEGAIAGRNAACFPNVEAVERDLPFTITFTDPPVAILGEPAGEDSVIGCAPYDDQGRAKVMAQAEGMVRIYASRPDGRLTGAAMIGPGMDHIAHLLALAIMRGETATGLLALAFYHPTLEEGLKPGLREICHEVHAPLSQRDQGIPPGA